MLDLIRGKDVNRALATLKFTRKGIAEDIAKVLRSAIANAQNKEGFSGDVDRLFVSACYANQGPSQKRVRPAPMGRAFRVLKRTAHLTVHVSERPEKVVRASRPTRRTSGRGVPQGKKPAAEAASEVRRRKTGSRKSEVDKEGEGVTVGQKVHPFGFRLGFNKTWRSRWYSDRDYAKLLHEDLALRSTLKKRFAHAGVSKIETERAANQLKIDIYTSRPGIIIGRKGTEVDKLKQEIQKQTSREVFINIQEIQKPELDAQLISESVAMQLEKRVAFRRAMRKAVESALRFGARGIKVRVSGRSERRRNRALGVVPARPAAAADAARRHRLRLRRSEHDLRPDRHQGVAVQGRAPGAAARPRGRVPESARRGGRRRGRER